MTKAVWTDGWYIVENCVVGIWFACEAVDGQFEIHGGYWESKAEAKAYIAGHRAAALEAATKEPA